MTLSAKSPALSIVIPVGPKDHQWRSLQEQFQFMDYDREKVEILWVFAKSKKNPNEGFVPNENSFENRNPSSFERFIFAPLGRAIQMNAGFANSQGKWIWFLHCDSVLPSDFLRNFAGRLDKLDLNRIYYFGLQFKPSNSLMKITEIGTFLRSRFFGLPFGDQGLLMRREIFEKLSQFSTTDTLGEDLHFVLRAKRIGIKLNRLDEVIQTSSRKYLHNGWLKTTLRHQWHTWKIVWQERRNK